jgi:dsRNA-specific ribonuclease
VRAHLVREDSLHRVALALGLPEVLRLSEGEPAAAARSARRSWPTRWRR